MVPAEPGLDAGFAAVVRCRGFPKQKKKNCSGCIFHQSWLYLCRNLFVTEFTRNVCSNQMIGIVWKTGTLDHCRILSKPACLPAGVKTKPWFCSSVAWLHARTFEKWTPYVWILPLVIVLSFINHVSRRDESQCQFLGRKRG